MLNLDTKEENTLCEYLLKRKSFVISYILNQKSFSPYTHLYQLYLQYLSYKLNEVEKSIFLAGYKHMLQDLYRNNYSEMITSLERKLNLCPSL